MPHNYSYYVAHHWGLGSYPNNAQKLAEDAVDSADAHVNFANYDYNHDGWVDALIIVHAGPGAEQTGSLDDIWSHKWNLSTTWTRDGVKLYDYDMDPETRITGLVDMGVFGHEFGHTLGLPDLYDTDYSSEGLGRWSMMASGSWNNDGKTPAHFDAWCKYKRGWIEMDTLTANLTHEKILQIETSPKAYRLWTSGGGGSEYFLVENRQKTRFDKSLPGEGLLIYHVDENGSNSSEWCPGDPATPHYKVALEQSDGQFQLEGCYGSPGDGDSGDPFPGYWDKRAFDDTTATNSRNYSGAKTQVAVWNISDSDSSMYANLDVTWSRPCLFLDSFALNDTIYGNGNGLPEPGEKIILYFTISNIWLPLLGTTVTGSADKPGIIFTDSQSYVGDIATGGSVNNHSDPIEFQISPGFANAIVTFTLHIVGNAGTYSLDLTKEARIGHPDILIVDDDSGTGKYNDYESYYTSALDSLQLLYNVWDKVSEGDTVFSFSNYRIMIWYTGDHRTSIFSHADVDSLMSFLDNGGRLFLTSQDVAEALSRSGDSLDSIFLADYLHCSLRDDTCTQRLIRGEPGDTVGDTLYIQTYQGAGNQTSKDVLLPIGSAVPVLKYVLSGWNPTDSVAGLRYQGGNYKLVFFGFGFEGINPNGQLYQNHYLSKPHFVMQRVLDWLQGYTDVFDFEEEYTNRPKTIELFQNHPNPFNPNTSIQFTVNGGQSPLRTTLKIYNIRGQLVKTLVDEDKLGGNYALLWDASGIYCYKLTAGSSSETKKMVLLK
jgi:M6 family metalloprotease-like protein